MAKRTNRLQHSKRLTYEWMFLLAALVTAVVPLVLYMKVSNHGTNAGGHTIAKPGLFRRHVLGRKQALPNTNPTSFDQIIDAANQAEAGILFFFRGESRALKDGTPYGDSAKLLTERLAYRIAQCQKKPGSDSCILKVVFVGSGQTTGRDNFFNETYPFFMEHRLSAVVEAAGLELQVYNHAMDSDLSREGPQSTHLCIGNLVGDFVDVIAWDMDGNMQASPPAQVEAFVRWASVAQPAMIIINKGGPHGRSRRGTKRFVVNLGPGHDAEVYEDDPNDMPEARQDAYRESHAFQGRWQKGRNNFWEKIFDKYGGFIDFAAVDPEGSIWHLDHLQEFSNQAFDGEKALPLVDCGPMHPPPCDQIPEFVQNHLARANLTIDNIPKQEIGQGAVCLAQLGCRHMWYGGKRSHNLRGELNALPILRALRDAGRALQRDANKYAQSPQQSLISVTSLPPPEFCKATFCDVAPRCISAYIPNLGPDLGNAIRTAENEARPRKGACHFLDDPIKQVSNLETRYSPLGYIDRKYAYRLSVNDPKKKHLAAEDTDASATTIAFSTAGPGPLVLCEPPCFIDSCSKHRKKPFIDFVTLELDGKKVDRSKVPHAVEVGGPFCQVVTGLVEKGDHTLRISTTVVSPEHVMLSAVIPFS